MDEQVPIQQKMAAPDVIEKTLREIKVGLMGQAKKHISDATKIVFLCLFTIACGRQAGFQEEGPSGQPSSSNGTVFKPEAAVDPSTEVAGPQEGSEAQTQVTGTLVSEEQILACRFFNGALPLINPQNPAQDEPEYRKFYQVTEPFGVFIILPTPIQVQSIHSSSSFQGSFSEDNRYYNFTFSTGQSIGRDGRWNFPYQATETGAVDDQQNSVLTAFEEHKYQGRVTICDAPSSSKCKFELVLAKKGIAPETKQLPAANAAAICGP
jgi:hypothetical protein